MKVTLLKPITLAREPKEIGAEIDVDEATADWLAEPNRAAIAPRSTTKGTGKAGRQESVNE